MRRLLGTVALLSSIGTAAAAVAEDEVRFNRDVRPILSEKCFRCHGPDEKQRQGELRLDVELAPRKPSPETPPIVPGKPEASGLLHRVTSTDADQRMPPPEFGPPLSPREIDVLRRWIAQGAKWEGHWAFIPPQRPQPPDVSQPEWVRNGLDAFVLARLDREGLRPSPEAERTTLIRRATLDLTGLPPTPAEVDAFLADASPDAYERVVDRLLASPRYGERMSAVWLDAARYADTSGYQSDGERFMWRWRDWVIDAHNANVPFDRFTIEQLAGDLLPQPTLEQRIATAFNRNHRGNAEGGIIPEEYAVEYVVDRVDTTATVWLGLTMGCARCHDHKYDPLSQKDFYRLFAYFNNVPENGRAVKFGNSPPMILTPTRDQQTRLVALRTEVAQAKQAYAAVQDDVDAELARWESATDRRAPDDWTVTDGLTLRLRFDDALAADRATAAETSTTTAGTWRGNGNAAAAKFVAGPIARAVEFDGTAHVEYAPDKDLTFDYLARFTMSAWVKPRGRMTGAIVSRMGADANRKGYELVLDDGCVQANFGVRWLDDSVRVQTATRLVPDRWQHVLATYDGSRTAAGIRIWIDGEPQPLTVNLDELNQTFDELLPLHVGAIAVDEGIANRFDGAIDDVRLHRRVLSNEEIRTVATATSLTAILAKPAAVRSPLERHKLREFFVAVAAPERLRTLRSRRDELAERLRVYEDSLPTTMVMEESPRPRPTHVLLRGEYDKPGERVEPGVPAALPAAPGNARRDRLGLAEWLVDPRHPLTARVAVNRLWQTSFGSGLVRTAEDFGSQGEWPSHPDLLDWLATEFVRTGWDMKRLRRTIVTSATYRQSSRTPPALLQRDPENRLFARGPRLRLTAEAIRDQALFAGGLLAERLGGPSVKPYQPDGLWKEIATLTNYEQSHGPDLHRRSLYTFWKRTVSPPAMSNFDASTRETCVVRTPRTNTPLQALTLLNDVTFVEAARAIAQRMLLEGGESPDDRIAWGFRLLTSRPPRAAEATVLRTGLERHREHYRTHPQEAAALLAFGEWRADPSLDPSELAAYAALANALLNLDETITRE